MHELVFTPPVMPVALLREGFNQAAQRYHDATFDNDRQRMRLALFEALNWAAALDDRLQRQRRDRRSYANGVWSDDHFLGDVVKGVRYARGRVHHEWAEAIHFSPGAGQLPVRCEGRWLPGRGLPPAPPKHTRFAVEYDWNLAGEPVRITLGKLSMASLTLSAVWQHRRCPLAVDDKRRGAADSAPAPRWRRAAPTRTCFCGCGRQLGC